MPEGLQSGSRASGIRTAIAAIWLRAVYGLTRIAEKSRIADNFHAHF